MRENYENQDIENLMVKAPTTSTNSNNLSLIPNARNLNRLKKKSEEIQPKRIIDPKRLRAIAQYKNTYHFKTLENEVLQHPDF
jgi:hypothetical protein